MLTSRKIEAALDALGTSLFRPGDISAVLAMFSFSNELSGLLILLERCGLLIWLTAISSCTGELFERRP